MALWEAYLLIDGEAFGSLIYCDFLTPNLEKVHSSSNLSTHRFVRSELCLNLKCMIITLELMYYALEIGNFRSSICCEGAGKFSIDLHD